MIPLKLANRLRWVRRGAREKYARIVERFETLRSQVDEGKGDIERLLETAHLHIKLGEPLQALERLRTIPIEDASVFVQRRILQSRALWAMRMSEAAAYLIFTAIKRYESYDLCLELARLNFFLALNARRPQQAKESAEASASTLKHCIRLDPSRPEAYALHAHIAAPYDEWQALSDEYYSRFERAVSEYDEENVDCEMLWDAFSTNWLRGRYEQAQLWLNRFQRLLEESPWWGDARSFIKLGFAFGQLGNVALYEEYLQVSYLMYPTKAGELMRYYQCRFRVGRVLQMLWLAARCTDMREYRWRRAFAKGSGVEKRDILSSLIGEPL